MRLPSLPSASHAPITHGLRLSRGQERAVGTFDLFLPAFLYRKHRPRRKVKLFPEKLETFFSFSIDLKYYSLNFFNHFWMPKSLKNNIKKSPTLALLEKLPFSLPGINHLTLLFLLFLKMVHRYQLADLDFA